MDEDFKELLSQTVNERVQGMRQQLFAALQETRQRNPGIDIYVKDGYSGLQYVSRVLFNSRDLAHARTATFEELFHLLVEAIEGAAYHRIEKQRKFYEKRS